MVTEAWRVNQVRRYIRETYDFDLLDPINDSLEQIMGQIYTDLFNPHLEADESAHSGT